MSYNYAVDRQLVSAEAFCAKIDSLISAFGGTPTDVELSPSALKSEANFRHQITDELFQAKMNQLVTAMGGTPSAIVPTSGNGYAATHGYVDLATFSDKLDEVAENAGGGVDWPCTITIQNLSSASFYAFYYSSDEKLQSEWMEPNETLTISTPKGTYKYGSVTYFCPNGMVYISTDNSLKFSATSTKVGTKAVFGEMYLCADGTAKRGYCVGVIGCEKSAELYGVTIKVQDQPADS